MKKLFSGRFLPQFAKRDSMAKQFRRYSIFMGCFIGICVLVISVLAITYLATGINSIVIGLLSFTLCSTVLLVLAALFYYRFIKGAYLDEMIAKTSFNYEMLAKQKKRLIHYDGEGIEEFNTFNEYIDVMNNVFKNVDLSSKPLDYSSYDLVFPNEEIKNLITVESLNKNIRNFILSSSSFRNALIFFGIDAETNTIGDKDYNFLIEMINKNIKLPDTICAISKARGGVLLFCPKIDSISYFKEALEKVIKDSVFYSYEATGVRLTKVRAAMVVYPYSSIDDILTDLRYADRQGKTINIYLPKRLYKTNDTFNHSTLMLNNLTKTFLEYNAIDLDTVDDTEAIKKMCALMKDVRINLGFENVGSIMFEGFSKQFYCTYNDCDDEANKVFEINSTIKKELIEVLYEIQDDDHSYYFSCRNNASDKIGPYLDIYGIRSGHFFVIKNNKKITGVMYFLNKNKDCYLNSAARELLFVFSTYLCMFSKELHDKQKMEVSNMRVRDILRLSELDMYTIDKDSYELQFVSPSLNSELGLKKHGGKCYNVIFGLDEPCPNCPLGTRRKMHTQLLGKEATISNILSRKKSLLTTMIVEKHQDEYLDSNRFHHDLFIFSHYSLVDHLNGLYKAGIRGTLILLHIDNCEELVKQYQNEGYFLRVKEYITALKKKLPDHFDIFSYNDDTLAIIFNEEGRVDVVKNCERMFNLSRNLFITTEGSFNIEPTFIVFDFPLDHPTPVDFARSVTRYLRDNKDIYNQHLIIVPSSNYRRSADREQFVLTALVSAFRSKQIKIKLLPIYGDNDKTIVGSEMLMRLNDTYLNISISAYEFIDIAKKHGYIGRLSTYLIDYMGSVYQKYGVTPFTNSGFRYFSMNTDSSFLKDENFISNMSELQKQYRLPKNFLSLEVEEKDIADNFEFYKSITKKIMSYDMLLVVDDYTGELVSLDKLHDMGFSHVKVSRRVVDLIDKDVNRFNEIREGLIDCDEVGIKAVLVGIETKDQHDLLSEFKSKFYRQGYYYTEPVEIDAFMDLLKKNNR